MVIITKDQIINWLSSHESGNLSASFKMHYNLHPSLLAIENALKRQSCYIIFCVDFGLGCINFI